MSVGTRSGVNWMRANVPPTTLAKVSTARVLATPGTPSSSTWPLASRPTSIRSTRRSWPTMIRLTSKMARSRVCTSCCSPPLFGGAAWEPGPANNGGLQQEVHTLERAIFEVKRIIVGQDLLVERMLVGLLAKGHVLLEGVPGVAKTLAVETFAKVVGGTFARIQFTPDLVPTDIVGTRIYR